MPSNGRDNERAFIRLSITAKDCVRSLVCIRQTNGQSRGLRCRSAASRLLGLCVFIPPAAWIFVCCDCCVLSGRGLCDELITRPEKPYGMWCVVVCDLETCWRRRPWSTGGELSRQKQTNKGTGSPPRTLIHKCSIQIHPNCALIRRTWSLTKLCKYTDKDWSQESMVAETTLLQFDQDYGST